MEIEGFLWRECGKEKRSPGHMYNGVQQVAAESLGYSGRYDPEAGPEEVGV